MDNFFTRQRRRRQEANALYDLWFSVIPGPAPSGPLPSGRSSAGGPSLVARGPVPARSMTADELEAVQAEQREAVFDFIIERGLVSDEYWVVEGIDRLDARDGLGSHQSAPVRLAVDGAATAEGCERVLRQFE